MDGDGEELLRLLLKRRDILNEICDNNYDKQRIQSTLEISRPTVDRAFREFNEAGVLNTIGTSHQLSSFGNLFCETNNYIRKLMVALVRSEQLFSDLSMGIPIDLRLLIDADFIFADSIAPQQQFVSLVEELKENREIWGYASTILPSYVKVFEDLHNNETSLHIVVTEQVSQVLKEHFGEKYQEMSSYDSFSISISPLDLPFGILIVDETEIIVPVGGEGKQLRAIIRNDTNQALDWGFEMRNAVESGSLPDSRGKLI